MNQHHPGVVPPSAPSPQNTIASEAASTHRRNPNGSTALTPNEMTLIYSTNLDAKLQLVRHLQTITNDPIAVAETEQDLITLARVQNPKVILLYMPGKIGLAMEIQEFLRQRNPRRRVRILSIECDNDKLLAGWQNIVAKALKRHRPSRKNLEKRQS
jgi:hypothetical protein